jgi:hypothetical protein
VQGLMCSEFCNVCLLLIVYVVFGLYILSCVGSGSDLSIELN